MSPRNKEDNEIIRERRKAHILEVALNLFARIGYDSTTISKIATKAKISKGLMYNYFNSKEDLLKSLIFDLGKAEEVMMSTVIDDDAKKMLENIFISFFTTLVEDKDKWKLITALSFQVEKFDFIQDLASKKMAGYHFLFEDLLTRSGVENAKDEARLLGAIFDGIAVQYLVIHDDYPLDQMKKYLISKYCNS
jgi:AcrR family transcriptional regulator